MNTSRVAEINNKYELQLHNERENNTLVINQLRLEKKELEILVNRIEETRLKDEKEVGQLLELLEEN